jgi:hypothetical protein
MQSLTKLAFIGYLAYLTALLWTADPSQLIGGRVPGFLQTVMFMAHTLAFSVLAVLALSVRWPAPRWLVIVLLAGYGGLTEIVQGFLPPRTPKWADWCQDLLGIAIGATLCWIAARVFHAAMGPRQGWGRGECPAPVRVDVSPKAVSLCDADSRSPRR